MTEQTSSQPMKRKFASLAFYLMTVLLLLGIGGGVLAYLVRTKPSSTGEPPEDAGRQVRVFGAKRTSHRVAITAYGTTRASEVWTAICEVPGRAIDVSSRFEPGEILPAGLLLVKIDPTDYELAERRLKAEVRAKNEELRELNQNEANFQTISKLQQRQLELAAGEYQRQRTVFEKNAASRSALEAAENAYITSLTALQQTRNSLALVPVQRDLIRASLDMVTAQLAQATRDKEKCVIRLPMAARCASKSVEDNQYMTTGERLGTFLALDTAEVVAKVETRKMRALFPGGIKELGPLDLTQARQVRLAWRQLKVPAEVRWGLGDLPSVWHGRLVRIGSSLDPGTRTVPVIIEIRDPYKGVKPGVRPPLIPDVFCEVTLYGATLDDVVVIPRDALRDDRVYLLRDGRLHIQPVTVAVLENDAAVISQGIEQGDQVILTDLFPASEGMPLRAEVVPNPAKPRGEIHFPDDLFEKSAEPTTEAAP